MKNINELDKDVELKYELEIIGEDYIPDYIIPIIIIFTLFLLYILN